MKEVIKNPVVVIFISAGVNFLSVVFYCCLFSEIWRSSSFTIFLILKIESSPLISMVYKKMSLEYFKAKSIKNLIVAKAFSVILRNFLNTKQQLKFHSTHISQYSKFSKIKKLYIVGKQSQYWPFITKWLWHLNE